MKSVAVYCGSSAGFNPTYAMAAQELGQLLAEQDIRLVYGGDQIGIMGAVADAVLDHGGIAIGIIPDFLSNLEVAHGGLTELLVVENMTVRKAEMFERAEGFIVLPGGNGTMEEFFEVFSWGQLSLHAKPIGILNVNGYYDHLIQHLKHSVEEGFLQASHFDICLVSDNPSDLLKLMQAYEPNHEQKKIPSSTRRRDSN